MPILQLPKWCPGNPSCEFGPRESVLWSRFGHGRGRSQEAEAAQLCQWKLLYTQQLPSASSHAQDPEPSSWLSFSHCGSVTQGEASELPVLDQSYLSHKIPVWTQTNLYYSSNLDADISLTCPLLASTSPALSGSCPQLVLIPFVLLGDLGRAGASLERGLSAASSPPHKPHSARSTCLNFLLQMSWSVSSLVHWVIPVAFQGQGGQGCSAGSVSKNGTALTFLWALKKIVQASAFVLGTL